MPERELPILVRDVGELRPPRSAAQRRELAIDGVEHEIEELVLAGGAQVLAVRDSDRRTHDLGERELSWWQITDGDIAIPARRALRWQMSFMLTRRRQDSDANNFNARACRTDV
jgi:hypothetical protein